MNVMENNLVKWRYDNGLSIAAAASEVGVAPSTWLAWEHGTRTPHASTAKRVADRIGLRPSEIWPVRR